MNVRSALLLVLATTVCGLGGLISPQVVTASVDAVTQWPSMPPIVSNSNAGALSGKFTVGAGTNRVLLVAVATEYTSGNPTIAANGVTYGGTALTNIAAATNTTGLNKIWVGYLVLGTATAPSTATLAVTNTGTAGLTATYVTAAVYNGVDQTTPITGSGSASGSTATLTTSNFAVTGLNGNTGLAAFISNFNGATLNTTGTATKVRDYAGANMNIGAGQESVVTNATDNQTVTASAAVSGVLAGVGLNPATRIATNATCGDCHGYPPQDGSARNVPSGQFTGSHDKHAGANANQYTFICTQCHYNNTTNYHSTGYRNITGSSVPGNAYSATKKVLSTNSSGTGTCTNVTCHSTGRANRQFATSPAWGSASTCQSCHGGRNAGGTYVKSTTGFSMSTTHGQHLGKYTATEINCQMCHGKTAQNNTALKNYTGSIYHANSDKTVYFTDIAYGSYTSYKKSGTDIGKCTNTACHGGKSRSAWTNTGAINTNNTCTHCHGVANTSAALANVAANRKFFAPGWGGTGTSTDQLTATNDPRVGAHFVHLSSVYMPKLKCNECHYVPVTPFDTTNGGTHMKNTRYNSQSITFGQASTAIMNGLAGFTSFTSGTGTKAATCSTVYCHGAKMPRGDTGGTAKKPSWNQDTLISQTPSITACSKCHGAPPRFGFSSTAHRSVASNDISLCNGCHNSVSTSGAIVDKSKHMNGAIDASGGHSLPYPGATHMADASPISKCTGCHTNTGANSYPTTVGTKPDCRSCHALATPGSGCNSCHGSDGTGKPSGGGTVLGAFPNYSGSHTKHVVGQSMACTDCHYTYGTTKTTHGSSGATGSAQGTAHNNVTFVGLSSPNGKFHATKTSTSATCSNVACHGTATWGVTKFNCLTCHAVKANGVRAAVTSEFGYQSHHVQGSEKLTVASCFQCHWEAKDSSGTVDPAYHSGTSGKGVSLVVWNAATRPATASSSTLISYTANGSRSQIYKLNNHCLGCHNTPNQAIAPFGVHTTSKYSPEARLGLAKTSISSRYTSSKTTPWSTFNNFSSYQFGNNRKWSVTKALSAHGNAISNEMPTWNASVNGSGEDKRMADYTKKGSTNKTLNVLCFDCHNSHGSNATGITSSYSSATGRNKGGLLKTTVNGERGYTVGYTPTARTVNYKNYSTTLTTAATFNPGASICNDCHNNDTRKVNINKPWSITGTYSSTKAIVGYWSTPYFDNYTVNSAKRSAYKSGQAVGTGINGIKDYSKPMGGHFGSSINGTQAGHGGEINGLCTPCHDPHGVSTSLGTNRDHGVPLLKGTWMTTPYLEDKADIAVQRGGGSRFSGVTGGGYIPGYHIDQNTLLQQPAKVGNGARTSNAVGNIAAQKFRNFSNVARKLQTATPAEFAGLCLQCHNQASLTNSTVKPTGTNWKTTARIHQSVATWANTSTAGAGNGRNMNNKVHAYTCSKCHSAHVSRLPRLLVTNCLDTRHAGMVVTGGSVSSTTGSTATQRGNIVQSTIASGKGVGRFPAGGAQYANNGGGFLNAKNPGGWWFGGNKAGNNITNAQSASYSATQCHNSSTAGSSGSTPDLQQRWNKRSNW